MSVMPNGSDQRLSARSRRSEGTETFQQSQASGAEEEDGNLIFRDPSPPLALILLVPHIAFEHSTTTKKRDVWD